MTVTIRADVEPEIVLGARTHHVSEEQYVNDLLAMRASRQQHESSRSDEQAAEDLMAGFLKLAETASPVPDRQGEFYSRDVMYDDHD